MQHEKSHYRFSGSTIFRRALTFAGIFIALQISIISFISNYTQYSLIRQAKMNTEYILDLCKETMNSEIEAIDKTLKYLQTQDAYLRLMNSSQSVVAYHAAYELRRIVDASSFAESQGITYIMADSTGQLLVQHRDDQFSYSSLKAMESKLAEIGWQGVSMDSRWHMTQVEQSWYLEHYYNREGSNSRRGRAQTVLEFRNLMLIHHQQKTYTLKKGPWIIQSIDSVA